MQKSNRHELAMIKWISYRMNKKYDTSITKLLDNAHKKEIAHNREYLKVIIECLLYSAQQKIAQRGQG